MWNLKKAENNNRKNSSCQDSQIGGRELTAKGHEGTLGGNRNVLYFDPVGGYTTVSIGRNSLAYTLELGKLSEFYYMWIIPQWNWQGIKAEPF